MEMERINENTIRVLIGNDDLNQRGITVLDLLGNHKQIENFFYSILEEVDVDHQFQEIEAVTFQVLPILNGLELFISKNNSDNAFYDNQETVESISQEDIPDFLNKRLIQRDEKDKKQVISNSIITKHDMPTPIHTVILELHSFEDMISLALNNRLTDTSTSLYFYKNNYYLELTFQINEYSSESIKDELSIAYEYADKSLISVDVLEEHGQTVMDKSALELTRKYFIK